MSLNEPHAGETGASAPPEPDRLLGGKVLLAQPKKGFRTPVDSFILAASLTPAPGSTVLDVGCGIGTVGFCLASRCREIRLSGLDIDGGMLELAAHNAGLNGVPAEFAQGDILAQRPPFNERQFDAVLSNPPFYSPDRHRSSPDEGRRRAMQLTDRDFQNWVSFCLRRVRSGGEIALMVPPARLPLVLDVFAGKAGSIRLFPVWSKARQSTKRVLIRAVKGGRGGLEMQAGLIMHRQDGTFTEDAAAVLQHGTSLDQLP